MNIAIVDDEKSELLAARDYLLNYIKKFHAELESDVDIQTFSCAEDFLKIFQPNFFQIIILDIIMEDIDGLQAAQIIRGSDPDVNIVFLTNNDDFILKGYSVFAVGYFIKPISNHAAEFANTFEHIFNKITKNNPEITVSADNIVFPIPYINILYIDLDFRHKLCFHLADNKKIAVSNNYADICDILLKDDRFSECYHRIIVNMDFIKAMDKEDFILTNDKRIPISQRKKKDVKAKFMRYLAHK